MLAACIVNIFPIKLTYTPFLCPGQVFNGRVMNTLQSPDFLYVAKIPMSSLTEKGAAHRTIFQL